MNDKQQQGTEAQELDEAKLDQASGAWSLGASNPTTHKAATSGNKLGQDDWLTPK